MKKNILFLALLSFLGSVYAADFSESNTKIYTPGQGPYKDTSLNSDHRVSFANKVSTKSRVVHVLDTRGNRILLNEPEHTAMMFRQLPDDQVYTRLGVGEYKEIPVTYPEWQHLTRRPGAISNQVPLDDDENPVVALPSEELRQDETLPENNEVSSEQLSPVANTSIASSDDWEMVEMPKEEPTPKAQPKKSFWRIFSRKK